MLSDLGIGWHTLWLITPKELMILLLGLRKLHHVLNFCFSRWFIRFLIKYTYFSSKKKKKKKQHSSKIHIHNECNPSKGKSHQQTVLIT